MVTVAGRWASVNGGPPIFTAIDEREAQALAAYAHDRVLEIGSAYGYSAIVMASAGAQVTTVDCHEGENPGSFVRLHANIADYRLRHRITAICDTSQRVLPAYTRDGRRFEVVFIDGDHSLDAARHDIALGWELVAPGGYLICHDYGEPGCPGVAEALDELWPEGADMLIATLWIKRKEDQ
jgi:predicted O-methyltransferase YrrM